MAETSYPFDGSTVDQTKWQSFAKWMLQTGVIKGALGTDCQLTAPSSGMQVQVYTGIAWINGFWYQLDATKQFILTMANPTYARIDRIVLRLDMTAKNITANVLTGTAASSPTPPALTQTSTLWEMSLAQIHVAAGQTLITNSNITDERIYAAGVVPVSLPAGTLINGATFFTTANMGPGSGLDADTLDGVQGASYFTLANDGAGSGLDADKVDGHHVTPISGCGGGTFNHGHPVTPTAIIVQQASLTGTTCVVSAITSTQFTITWGSGAPNWTAIAIG